MGRAGNAFVALMLALLGGILIVAGARGTYLVVWGSIVGTPLTNAAQGALAGIGQAGQQGQQGQQGS